MGTNTLPGLHNHNPVPMMKRSKKPILCLDFDGVIHAYTSGWKGATTIPDPAVDGALKFIVKALPFFDVAIHSTRSRHWLGRRAMKSWLQNQFILAAGDSFEATEPWLRDWVLEHTIDDDWTLNVQYGALVLCDSISWPTHKPPAMVTIDDRAMTFQGCWPEIDALRAFEPWYKR